MSKHRKALTVAGVLGWGFLLVKKIRTRRSRVVVPPDPAAVLDTDEES